MKNIVNTGQEMEQQEPQRAGKEIAKGWNPKQRRGADRGTITLGGLHKVQRSNMRKEKQRLRRKLGESNVPVHEAQIHLKLIQVQYCFSSII